METINLSVKEVKAAIKVVKSVKERLFVTHVSLFTWGLEIYVSTDVKVVIRDMDKTFSIHEDLVAGVLFDSLVKIVNLAESDDLEFKFNSEEVKVNGFKFNGVLQKDDIYSRWGIKSTLFPKDKIKFSKEELKTLESFRSEDNARMNICGVALTTGDFLVATNGHTLVKFKSYDVTATDRHKHDPYVFNQSVMDVASAIGECVIHFNSSLNSKERKERENNTLVVTSYAFKSVWVEVFNEESGSYPQFEQVLPKDVNTLAILNPTELKFIATSAKKTLKIKTGKFPVMKIKLTGNVMTTSSYSEEFSFEDELILKQAKDTNEFNVGLNPEYVTNMTDTAKLLGYDSMSLKSSRNNDPLGPILFESDEGDCIIVLMPMRT